MTMNKMWLHAFSLLWMDEFVAGSVLYIIRKLVQQPGLKKLKAA